MIPLGVFSQQHSGSPSAATAKFDPVYKSASVTLVQGFEERRATTTTAQHCGVMGLPSKDSGKWFVEYIVHGSVRPNVGFAYSQANTNNTINPSLHEGIGMFWWSNNWRIYGGTVGPYVTLSRSGNLVVGDRVTVGYDLDTQEFHAYVNGEVVAGSPWAIGFNPTGTEVWPAARLYGGDDLEIATEPQYPIPGFQPW